MSATIVVRVIEGKGLIGCDKNGMSDPYCVVSFGSATRKTKTKKKSLSPDWSETEPFVFTVDNYSPGEILFEIFDWNKFYSHKRMGRAKLALKDLQEGQEQHKWMTLTALKDKDEVSGELHVIVQYNKIDEISNSNSNSNSSNSSLHNSLTSTDSMRRSQATQSFLATKPNEDEPALFGAIKNSDLEKVQELLKDSKLDFNMKDKYGYTPLHAACCLFSDRDDQILSLLLQQKDINVNVQNEDQNTPLHYFCAKFRSPNCTDAFEMFIEKGANVNAQNNNGETPLHKAIFNNSVRILMVRLLIKAGADVNKVNSLGETPLHYAVRLGREDLVSILLKGGADVTVKGTKEKKTPYDLAIEQNHEKMSYLLKRAKDVFDWLLEIGMEKYNTVFISEEMYKDLIPDLDEKILDRMNITTTGHRLKLLKAAKALKESLGKVDTNKPNSNSGAPNASANSSNKSTGTSNSVAPTSGTVEIKAVDIEAELEKLKYINKSGTWILHNSELEFTVKLGSGTSGTVYKGLYKGAEVAIKVLKTEQSQKELDEFKKEFQIMSTIQSPYIVFFFGACLEPKLCMVMELCGRGSLYHVMNDLSLDIDWPKVFSFSKEMVKGVDCLHSHQPEIVHRDFKSLNLMVNEQFHIKVGDFGLSRFNTDTQKETLAKMRGTFAYCAPEVYFGEKFSTKSDVFSIGIVLWELCVRCISREYQRPYQEFPNLHFDFQIIIQTAKKGLRPTIPATTPQKFADLIKESWSHEADKRPSCKEILERLDELENDFDKNVQVWNAAIQPTKETQK